MLSHVALDLCKYSWKYLKPFSSGHVSMTEINIRNVQRAITSAQVSRMTVLDFQGRLMVLYICAKVSWKYLSKMDY